MKKGLEGKIFLDHHVGCFGEFNREDLICKELCALRLRCAIEQDYNIRLEVLEDLMASEGMPVKFQ